MVNFEQLNIEYFVSSNYISNLVTIPCNITSNSSVRGQRGALRRPDVWCHIQIALALALFLLIINRWCTNHQVTSNGSGIWKHSNMSKSDNCDLWNNQWYVCVPFTSRPLWYESPTFTYLEFRIAVELSEACCVRRIATTVSGDKFLSMRASLMRLQPARVSEETSRPSRVGSVPAGPMASSNGTTSTEKCKEDVRTQNKCHQQPSSLDN